MKEVEIREALQRFWYQAVWSNEDESVDYDAEVEKVIKALPTTATRMAVEARISELEEVYKECPSSETYDWLVSRIAALQAQLKGLEEK